MSCQQHRILLTVSDKGPGLGHKLAHFFMKDDMGRKRNAAETEQHAIVLLWADKGEKEIQFLLHLPCLLRRLFKAVADSSTADLARSYQG